jgi:Restriction endonuclease
LPKSRYDELHDKYFALLSTKAGTRYERLAAMVFKILHESDAVVHDLRLVGDSSVAHQIDVQLTVRGKRRRVIVECKDYDISGEKVGLDIIRNFWAVVEDTPADEGYIITCNAFTDDARRFAKAKNIKLAILRRHEENDWAGYIRTVVIKLIAVSSANVRVNVFVPNETERARSLRLQRASGVQGKSGSTIRFMWCVMRKKYSSTSSLEDCFGRISFKGSSEQGLSSRSQSWLEDTNKGYPHSFRSRRYIV